jgi:hypothetical protein
MIADRYDRYDMASFAVYPDKTVPIAVKTDPLGPVKVSATPGGAQRAFDLLRPGVQRIHRVLRRVFLHRT